MKKQLVVITLTLALTTAFMNQHVSAQTNSQATSTQETVQNGSVVCHYVDQDGHKIANDVTYTGPIGSPYTAQALEIANYRLVNYTNTPAGSFSAQGAEYTFYYQKVTQNTTQTYVVNYVDENQKVLLRTSIIGEIGQAYQLEQKSFNGYHFVAAKSDDLNGTYQKGFRVLYLVYAKDFKPVAQKSTITLKFVNENNQEIAKPITYTGTVDQTLNLNLPVISGYTLTNLPTNYQAVYKTNAQTITVKYQTKNTTTNKTNQTTPAKVTTVKETPTVTKTSTKKVATKQTTDTLPQTGTKTSKKVTIGGIILLMTTLPIIWLKLKK